MIENTPTFFERDQHPYDRMREEYTRTEIALAELFTTPPDDPTALCQAVCTLLRQRVSHYTWVGIYLVKGSDLILAAWDGPQATEHVRIPIGTGICGAAAAEGATIVVPDVDADPRYLQCFLDTRSEIVVPIWYEGQVIGEIDIDSSLVDAFNSEDQALLEWAARHLGRLLGPAWAAGAIPASA